MTLKEFGFKNPIQFTLYYCRKCKTQYKIIKPHELEKCGICNRETLININKIKRKTPTFIRNSNLGDF